MFKNQKGFIQIPLFGFLAAATRPLVIQILAVLGIGLISFTGVTTLINTLIQNSRTAFGSLPSGILQLAGLAGVGEAFGIIAAAILVRVSLSFLPRFGRIPT